MYLVSSSRNVSTFHITWLDIFWTDFIYTVYVNIIYKSCLSYFKTLHMIHIHFSVTYIFVQHFLCEMQTYVTLVQSFPLYPVSELYVYFLVAHVYFVKSLIKTTWSVHKFIECLLWAKHCSRWCRYYNGQNRHHRPYILA